MKALDLPNSYRLTISEMTRQSQLDVSAWFNEWITGAGLNAPKLDTVSAISTQIILHSRLTLYQDGFKCTPGRYEIEEGVIVTLPLTEASLNNDLPASLVAWMIDAAGEENAFTLQSFLAGVRVMAARGMTAFARLSANGPLNNQTSL